MLATAHGPERKGTCLVVRIAKAKRPVVLGAPDGRITPRGGLQLVAKLDELVGISAVIDDGNHGFKVRCRGLTLGGLMVSLAETMLAGGDFFCDLDHQRADRAGVGVRAVPGIPPRTTAIGLGRRFTAEVASQLETANGRLVRDVFARLPAGRREKLVSTRPTIDLDPTDIEVYGRKKEGSDFNYQGQRVYRSHPAVWAETGWVLAADFGSGRSDPRTQAASLLTRAVAALPDGLGRPIIRGDSGFFDHKIADAALEVGADYAIAVKRTGPVWRSERKIPVANWEKARGMNAEVAECDYVPAGWPPGARTICRRVMVTADDLSTDPRSRRRRTIDPNQLALLEAGVGAHAWAYSFLITNLDGSAVEIEAWFRKRALIEETIKDSKLGLALRHMPSGYQNVNTMWMWAALLAVNLSSWLQALTGHDTAIDPLSRRKRRRGRVHGKRLRRDLICVPTRITTHAGRIEVHCSPEDHHGPFGDAWRTLDQLLVGASP